MITRKTLLALAFAASVTAVVAACGGSDDPPPAAQTFNETLLDSIEPEVAERLVESISGKRSIKC